MSRDEPLQLTSPDFKRVTGKLRVVKRRKRSDPVTESTVSRNTTESGATKRRVGVRNPFRSLTVNDDAEQVSQTSTRSPDASPAPHSDSLESDCFIPGTPEKLEPWPTSNPRRFIIPSSPDNSSASQKLQRRQLATDEELITNQEKSVAGGSGAPANALMTVLEEVIPDYSLCTKLRLTSAFDLCSLTSSSADIHSQALEDFIRGQPSQFPRVALHRHLHCYVYPNLPWLRLFPRVPSNKASSLVIPENASSALIKQWRDTYASVYASLVSAHLSCGYFYALCEGFTLLFHRCAECKTVQAVVYPTTRGFRLKLQERGIDFTLPLQDEQTKEIANEAKLRDPSATEDKALSGRCVDQEQAVAGCDHNNSLTEEVNDPLEWLENIGLEKSHFPSLRASKVQMEEDSFRSIDYRPASTLLISGQQFVDRLVKFTRDYNKTVASTGELASIPPTILSRSPFLGATIQKLGLRSGWMVGERGERLSYIDLERPLLPGVVGDIMRDVLEPCVTSGETVAASMQRVDDTQVFNVIRCADSLCMAASTRTEPKASFIYRNHNYIY